MFHGPLAERRELVTDAPAAVAAFDDMHQPLHVAVVAVVVAGEQVAVIVEHERLRIAQTGGDSSNSVPSGLQRNTAPVSGTSMTPLPCLYVGAAIADAVIELAVGPNTRPCKS